jgi:hypothetical protein
MTSLGKPIEQILGIGALIVLAIGCGVVLWPFLSALLWAGVICFSTWPIDGWCERAVGGRGLSIGLQSGALTQSRCNLRSSRGTEEPSPEEIELCSAVHLALDELELGDLAVGPREREGCHDGGLVFAKATGERGQGSGQRLVEPGIGCIAGSCPGWWCSSTVASPAACAD